MSCGKWIPGQMVMPFESRELGQKVDRAVRLLKDHVTCGGVLAYSGGKDSDAILALMRRAGLNLSVVYNVTTFDPPEVVRHCREVGAWFDHPGTNYFRQIAVRGVPTRWRRWCCTMFKHGRVWADVTVLGVRKAESHARKLRWREIVDSDRGRLLCPIVDWSECDVWQFLHEERVGTCSLYKEGCSRLGCIGCPLARGSRIRDFRRWPSVGNRIRDAYMRYGATLSQSPAATEEFWHRWVNDIDNPEQPAEEGQCLFNELWA